MTICVCHIVETKILEKPAYMCMVAEFYLETRVYTMKTKSYKL